MHVAWAALLDTRRGTRRRRRLGGSQSSWSGPRLHRLPALRKAPGQRPPRVHPAGLDHGGRRPRRPHLRAARLRSGNGVGEGAEHALLLVIARCGRCTSSPLISPQTGRSGLIVKLHHSLARRSVGRRTDGAVAGLSSRSLSPSSSGAAVRLPCPAIVSRRRPTSSTSPAGAPLAALSAGVASVLRQIADVAAATTKSVGPRPSRARNARNLPLWAPHAVQPADHRPAHGALRRRRHSTIPRRGPAGRRLDRQRRRPGDDVGGALRRTC